jgi:hypothetical protein
MAKRYPLTTSTLTPADIKAARDWIADCSWGEGSLGSLTDEQVIRGISRHYAGGWARFLQDAQPIGA